MAEPILVLKKKKIEFPGIIPSMQGHKKYCELLFFNKVQELWFLIKYFIDKIIFIELM